MIQYEIRMTGFGRAMRALEQSDQIAFKEITQAMKKVAQDVKKGVQQRVPEVPVGNWGQWTDARSGRDLGFDAGQVRSSVRLRMNRFRQRGTKESMGLAYEVSMGSGSGAAGAIWALMGKGDRVTTTQGAALVQSINSRYPIERWNGSGQQGPRGMVAAYYAGKPAGFDEEIARKIERALDREMN